MRVALAVLCLLVAPSSARSVTILFDGAEPGVSNGTTSFSHMGSNWSGGMVAIVGDFRLYHSGSFSWMSNPPFGTGTSEVVFDSPADPASLSFAFMHGGAFSNVPPGTATAFDAFGNTLESLSSLPGVGMFSPLLGFSTTTAISKIVFTNATVDTFSYTLLPECDDGLDNDGDGLIDSQDPDCASPTDPLEAPDFDEDGVQDSLDNCILIANPMLVAPPPAVTTTGDQLDTDADGFGNQCDCDFDNDGTCGIADFNIFLPDFMATTDGGAGTDMNGDGAVGISDFSLFLPGFSITNPGPTCPTCPLTCSGPNCP